MTARQQRVLQALRRVAHFGATNTGIIPAPDGLPTTWTPLTRQLTTLTTIIARVADGASEQARHTTNTTLAATSEASLRSTLRAEMHVVTQVAQALRKSVPGIGVLKMPSSQVRVESLIKYADTLVKQATSFESVLIEHGLAPDFIAQVNGAIAALKASVDGRGTARSEMVSAGKQVRVGLEEGAQYVHLMDAALTKMLKSDPAKLALWKTAKRTTIKGVTNSTTNSATASMIAHPTLALATPATATPAPATPAPIAHVDTLAA